MLKTEYYQRGAADPILDNSLVLSIVREYAPEAKEVTGVDETGGEARTYAVDADIVLKVQRPHQLRNTTSLEKEAFFLRYLEKNCDVSVPRVLGYGKRDSVEYTVMTRMPGIAAKYADMTLKQRSAVVYELGKTLYKIHSLDMKPFIESGLFPVDNENSVKGICERWKAMFDLRLSRLLENGLPQNDASKASMAADKEIEKIAALDKVKVTALHTNVGDEHVFVTPENVFSGVIDFGDSFFSHPVFDLRRVPLHERKTILDGYLCEGSIDNSFITVWNVTYALDSIIDVLSSKKREE